MKFSINIEKSTAKTKRFNVIFNTSKITLLVQSISNVNGQDRDNAHCLLRPAQLSPRAHVYQLFLSLAVLEISNDN